MTVIRDNLHINPKYMHHENYGKYGYESQYLIGDINVMCSSNETLGILLELKGKGCRQIESYLLAQKRNYEQYVKNGTELEDTEIKYRFFYH